MKELRILMTGAGAPGAPGIIKSYRNNGERPVSVIGVDAKICVPTIGLLDNFKTIPLAADPLFIESVLTIAKENNVAVIQPLVTRELEIFAENLSVFKKEGIAVCVSPIETLQMANDKGKLLEALNAKGISVPNYFKVLNLTDFKRACKSLEYPKKPVCFKPTKANGSRGFRVIDSSVDRKKVLFEQKPNNIYITYEEAIDILGEGDFPELLVMEYLPGDEYSVDLLVDNGHVKYSIPRLRMAMNGGISTDCIVVNHEDVNEYAINVASSLGLHGNIGIQVRRDESGSVKILEINPRVQGTIVCCSAAGVNLPYYGIKLALNEDIPDVDVKWNTRMIRYWNECYYDDKGRPYTY